MCRIHSQSPSEWGYVWRVTQRWSDTNSWHNAHFAQVCVYVCVSAWTEWTHTSHSTETPENHVHFECTFQICFTIQCYMAFRKTVSCVCVCWEVSRTFSVIHACSFGSFWHSTKWKMGVWSLWVQPYWDAISLYSSRSEACVHFF